VGPLTLQSHLPPDWEQQGPESSFAGSGLQHAEAVEAALSYLFRPLEAVEIRTEIIRYLGKPGDFELHVMGDRVAYSRQADWQGVRMWKFVSPVAAAGFATVCTLFVGANVGTSD
jgi:hypothetical protein